MKGSIRVLAALLFCCLIALGDTVAGAQFPTRPVRLIVPFPPGGGTDIVARVLARGLASKWGQPVVVENRPGASGTIGFTLGANAAGDGHTLLFATHHLAVPPQEGYKLGYDPIKSFAPISLVADSPSYLFVNPSLAVKNVKEFIALAHAKPGQLNVATNGDASLKLKAFTEKTRINVVDVPFSGGAAAIASVMSGETQATFGSQGVPLAQAGKLSVVSTPAEFAKIINTAVHEYWGARYGELAAAPSKGHK